MTQDGRSTGHPLRRLWDHATDHRGSIIYASAMSVANKLMDIAPPLLIGVAVDVVVRREASFMGSLGIETARGQVFALAGLTAVVWLLESIFEYLFAVSWRRLAQRIQHDLRVDAFAHVMDQDQARFADASTGGLMAILNDDINQLERFLDRGANEILQVAVTVIVIGGGFFLVAPSIAWWAVAPIPLILLGSFRFQRTLEPLYAAVRDRVGELNATLAGALGGVATIKAFTAEDREVDRVREASADYVAVNDTAIRPSSAFIPLIRMAILFSFTAILILGGLQTLDGNLEVGVYSTLVFITQRLLWPLTDLGEVFDQYQRAMASTRRVLGLLADRPTIVDGDGELPKVVEGSVELAGVSFAYDDRSESVLRGVDLVVPAGELHAVVGATGAGKSTIIRMVLRLYDPTDGRVLLDGVDVRGVPVRSLREHFGLVSQDVFLFHGTVAENIRYGDPAAADADVRRAADLAEASEFIDALPDGLDTVVGERGQKLSGGQRQRLAIARAILRDPTVLLLDEATSAVDNETEAAIQRSLTQVAKGRTTIVIAHRLSTIVSADRIHVMADGQIVESGTHEELVAIGGRYAALWAVQTGRRDVG
ncbi:ABC transporter ATP-binding protein [Euzebya tangerina]|uniref:ABC transporter ATP-binding protein n=1 Tax=Euzebya tangerina TaxID=591198 RepID=UPI000E319958|nr:ABC transporter ATP-binding protein [Euzebya tangerina]